MFYVGFCPVCEEGTLGIRICGGCHDAVVLCDECDAVWLYADCAGDAIFPPQPDLPCPRCGASLYHEPSHWASRDEVAQSGWSAAVKGESAALDDECQLKVLALEPYYGGSHQAFLDGWGERSRHEWEIIGLPAYKWKWRMRHAAITMAQRVVERIPQGGGWDVVLCSDMLNLAEFLGLAPAAVSQLPAIAYFHENQLTYPGAATEDRDYHFAFTNLTTGLAADRVWFNSAYHRDTFLSGLRDFLIRMPDHSPLAAVDVIQSRAEVHPPGVEQYHRDGPRREGPLRILWAARWEHDKDPETFFRALEMLRARDVPFRVSVLGQSFSAVPAIFADARRKLSAHVDRWGYLESRADYCDALCDADIVVSTARHEFFGIAVCEAVMAGAVPIVPRKLAYPEILDPDSTAEAACYFHDGTAERVTERLAQCADKLAEAETLDTLAAAARKAVARFAWDRRAAAMDAALEKAAG